MQGPSSRRCCDSLKDQIKMFNPPCACAVHSHLLNLSDLSSGTALSPHSSGDNRAFVGIGLSSHFESTIVVAAAWVSLVPEPDSLSCTILIKLDFSVSRSLSTAVAVSWRWLNNHAHRPPPLHCLEVERLYNPSQSRSCSLLPICSVPLSVFSTIAANIPSCIKQPRLGL